MKNNYSRLKWVALIILGGILFFLSKAAFAATTIPLPLQKEISGVVEDKNGLPIPGVTVTVKNTNRGTVTNLDGEYNITAPANGILVFSYIGFRTVEIAVENNAEINVQLEKDVASLGEVKINAGYYTTTEREQTGNISRVTAEEIELQPVVSPIQALQGRMAGVEITPGGSNPGTASTIRIRGTNSLREEGNYPLYIIDGVPINSTPVETNSIIGTAGIDPLNNLNVSNIESIEVLKDADATAIYGSRGANGVVLITTKTGKQRGTGLEARFYTGVATVPNRLDLLNTEEYLEVRRAAFENDGVEPTAQNAYDLVTWDQDRYTDWQDFFYGGTAETTNANLSFSGGSDKTFFRLGGSYFSQGTVYPGDNTYNKITGNFNLDHSSEDEKLKLNFSANYGVDINDLFWSNSISSSTVLLPPNAPDLFTEDGSLNWEEWAVADLENPLAGYYNRGRTETNNLLSNLGLSYQILNNLQVRLNAGYTYYESQELMKRPGRSYNPSAGEPNNSFHLNSHRKSWILEPQLIFNDNFGDVNLDAIIGGTFQENTNSQVRYQGAGYVTESLIGNLDAAERVINASSQTNQYRYAAVFARIGTNWKRKIFINFTGRRDGSSRFGPENRFANFGAIGAAWIFTEEELIKNALSFLSFGKLRGSYGSTGNDQIGDYGYLDSYEATPGPGGLYPVSLANPSFSWEVNKKLEAALELGFFKDKLNLGISWYRNRSSNQLVGYPLPAITGFNTVQANLPATVENSGWEVEISSLNFNSDNFHWQTSLNFSIPKNRLVSYPGIEQSSYANTYRIGHPVNISLLYRYEGIDPETGLYQIADINGDGSFDYEDRVVIQDLTREYYGGINNNLSFKNFSLQFLLQYVKHEGMVSFFNAGRPTNQRDVVLDALNSNEDYQRISQLPAFSQAYNNAINSNLTIQDASFLRLKTFSLGYNLPESLLQSTGLRLRDGKFFLTGQNLFTISPYEGLDPELSYSSTSFGNLRTVTAGLQFNF
ncbi:SusC/RagA family TonB-linked outer membrane protein [Salegentibacter salinarum]|uniref:SusC/RagA family TonB-linked outer membrane protein n=1 Tax=Salegentibacter salinarum TaxID=447422 RepID=A0A2N0TSD1_9FLAO|nr:SusC/RagA family TonB-linked outer membrane protein [Salegentibacter salinarum]PKD17654.1 SusC/RagA family TonB-linked outer membrane protein [Salegentibacter salinarum]SKB50425.1 TonB-linked outer membrane protein, SusC/RagA family [Salegentibacter salinarum]